MPDLMSIRITLAIVFVVIFIFVMTVIFLVMRWQKRKTRRKAISQNRLSVDKMFASPNEDCDCRVSSENSYMNDNSAYFGTSSNKHHYTEISEVILKLHNNRLSPSVAKPNFHQPDVVQNDLFHQPQSLTPQLLYDYTYALPPCFTSQPIQQHSTPMGTVFFIPAPSCHDGPEVSHLGLNPHRNVPLPVLPHTIQVVSQVHSAPHITGPRPKVPLQNTPLAHLSLSSSVSSDQTLRILTLQDISRKQFQPSPLESTATSSGDVSKGVLRSSNSEISWNRPIAASEWSSMPVEGTDAPDHRVRPSEINWNRPIEASEWSSTPVVGMNVANCRVQPDSCDDKGLSLRSDALRTSSSLVEQSASLSAPREENLSSSTHSSDDSFTCSEFEEDVEIVNSHQMSQPFAVKETANQGTTTLWSTQDSFLTSSGPEFFKHINIEKFELDKDATRLLSSDYLLNWGPNFESLVGVCKDIAELPDTITLAQDITNSASMGCVITSRSKEVYV